MKAKNLILSKNNNTPKEMKEAEEIPLKKEKEKS